jgi:glutathione S-transferase
MRFVEMDEARAAAGLRLVVAAGVPSPWSQAAMGLFDMKGIDYLAVRSSRRQADELRSWSGSHNVPVVLMDTEPPRTGWAEILALAERLGGRMSLVPKDHETRVRMHGLAHELLGEGGLGWNVRLLMVHASFATGGREGWPPPVAAYLAPKYGYAPERAAPARERSVAALDLIGRTLESSRAQGHDYFLGAEPCALDVYAAAGLAPLAPMPHDVCPMLAPVRHAFETLDPTVRAAVPDLLLRHRDMMYQRHLPLPVRF